MAINDSGYVSVKKSKIDGLSRNLFNVKKNIKNERTPLNSIYKKILKKMKSRTFKHFFDKFKDFKGFQDIQLIYKLCILYIK